MKLCFGRDMNCTEGTKETEALIDSMTSLSRRFSLIKHFPSLGTTLQSSPYLLKLILPGFVAFRKVSTSVLKDNQITANSMAFLGVRKLGQ